MARRKLAAAGCEAELRQGYYDRPLGFRPAPDLVHGSGLAGGYAGLGRLDGGDSFTGGIRPAGKGSGDDGLADAGVGAGHDQQLHDPVPAFCVAETEAVAALIIASVIRVRSSSPVT